MLAADTGTGLVITAVVLALYLLPTIVAASRGVTNVGSIAIVNIFLGWTFIGWVVALAMAFKTAPPRVAPTRVVPAQTTRECPHCKLQMRRDASVCPNCHVGSKPWIQHEGIWWFQSDAGKWQWLDESTNTWTWYEEVAPQRAVSGEEQPTAIAPPAEAPKAVEAQKPPTELGSLEDLASLHARGVLTDEEFQKAKARLLGDAPPTS
jgi:hypothetical protein